MAEENSKQTTEHGQIGLTADELLEKLRRSLQRGGDFPASAKVVNELKMMTSNPKTTANQVTEVILREPSLGTRVLHLVNSSFYRRAKPIMTVSQAVVQIGMKPLAELCSGLILLQKFVPVARRGGPFVDCLQKTILTSLLAGSINSDLDSRKSSTKDEQGYLAGTFAELGVLLLAYYFPKIYEAAAKRAAAKNVSIGESIQQLTGLTPYRLSTEVLDALDLPDFYTEVLTSAEQIAKSGPAVSTDQAKPSPFGESLAVSTGKALFAAQEISTVVVSGKSKGSLDKSIKKIQNKLQLDNQSLDNVVGSLPQMFKDHCASIELSLPPLPEYVASYSQDFQGQVKSSGDSPAENQFMQFVDEIREAVEQQEPTASIITSVMETFAWGLDFDRVLLMLMEPGRRSLHGRMLLGNIDNFDPKDLKRPLGEDAERFAPDSLAIKENRPVFNGDPIFEDGWPMAVIPIGFGPRAIGIIYADRVGRENEEIDGCEQAAIGVLAELLDRSIGINSG